MNRRAVILFLMLLTITCMLMAPHKANAFDDDWDWSLGTKQVHRINHRRHHHHRDPGPRVYGWPREEFDGNRRPICLDHFIDVVSTEHTSKENAMEAARKLWMAQTSWHEGAQYLDLELAKDYRVHCGPSNPMDTMSTRINQAVNEVIGREGQNVRCFIRARPCRAQLEKGETLK